MRPEYSLLLAKLEDERDELKDCSRIWGEESALDPITAQRIANTMFDAGEAISSLERELAEAREALEPFADWGRLEELHGSTIGHADIADDENAMLVVGELQTHVGTAGDLRRLHRFLSTASQQGDSDAG